MKQGCKKVGLNHVSSCGGQQDCTVEVSPLHTAFLNPALTTTLPAGNAASHLEMALRPQKGEFQEKPCSLSCRWKGTPNSQRTCRNP